MRSFNPISVWTQTAIASKTARSVKSVQYGTLTFTNGGSDAPTATITSVDTTRSVLTHLGGTVGVLTVGSTKVATEFCRLTLTNATTVTGTRSSDFNGQDATIAFCVTEYY